MIGVDIGLPNTFITSPAIGMLGEWLFKITIFLGVVVIVSHFLTRIIKNLL